jgi:uroporphyrin-III C-methyltransferase
VIDVGLISLVGSGPVEPELVTLKAVRRLANANLVLYDALVGKDVLKLAPQARRLFVGKRAGRKSVDQETIHRSMVRAARRGPRVVRLKGGDPFVLGRGEEALALAKVGVPIEVIPGVSSVIAAPVPSDIPLTHRGLSSGFVVVAEHAEESFRPVLEPLAPNSLTVVVLMGRARRTTIASLLVVRGWRAETPAAIAVAASTDETFTWIATLDGLNTLLIFYSDDGRRTSTRPPTSGLTASRALAPSPEGSPPGTRSDARPSPRGWKS